ncbi:phage protein Gp36 family protein [Methylomonas sp. 11b]|uniref:phage protein Gp36 family protein n=1 Tax=Methylomonas sp. 11b TaxID=1168169 RepID=UPI00047ECD45|nr:phage protein Gp36 family protein [Methylomonas sp. 11b]
MPFATRADLLARSNARRLAQLAVPADKTMPPEAALRVAIDGGDLTGYTADEQVALTLALDAIDTALNDAEQVLIGAGVPDGTQTSLLARMASTIALFYLQGAERMTAEVQKAYDGVMDMIKMFKRGELDLVPAPPPGPLDPVISEDLVQFESSSRRYGSTSTVIEDW